MGHLSIMGKTKNGSLKPLAGEDRGGRGTLGSKAKFVRYMRMNGFSEAETKEALKDLNVNKQRRFTLMKDHFHALPEGARTSTPSHKEYLVTMGSLKINGFIPWSAVPKPMPNLRYPLSHCSSMTIFPKTPVRDGKITWADAGEDKSHDFPRRNPGPLVCKDGQKLWWAVAHWARNLEAKQEGLFDRELKSAKANPEVPRL